MPHQCSGITLYIVTCARTHCGTQHLPLKESVSCRLWILGKIQGGGGGGGDEQVLGHWWVAMTTCDHLHVALVSPQGMLLFLDSRFFRQRLLGISFVRW